jgi:flagellar FliL protein
MFKNKLFNMTLIIFIGISLLGAITFVLWKYTFAPTTGSEGGVVVEEKLSADEIIEQSVTTEEIITNLYDNNDYLVIKLEILLDSVETKEELEKRMGQANAIIISELSALTKENLKGPDGINRLEAILMNRFNDILDTGKVKRVLTIKRQFQ